MAKLAEVQLPESELKLLYTTAKLGTGEKLYQNKQYVLLMLVHAGNVDDRENIARINTIPTCVCVWRNPKVFG